MYLAGVSRWILLTSLIVAVMPGSLLAQEQEGEAVLRGFVRDDASGEALQGANVVLLSMDGEIQAAAAADENGFYQIGQLAPERYLFRVTFVGYQSYRDTIRLEDGERTTRSVSLGPAAKELEGVTVEGRQPVAEARAGLKEIGAADIETIPTPGPGSDLASYLRSLPGVTTTGDRGGRLYIRGGRPSQNLILVDGIPVYKPFHIVGLYSAFPGRLVSNTQFYAGGFDAEYLSRMSSVLDIRLRPGNTEAYQGSAGLGPFLTSAHVEGPINRGSESFLVHARHSLIEQSGPALLGQSTPYVFYDVTAKLHSQSDSHQCHFTGLRTYDRGRIDPDNAASFRWNNTAAGGQCLLFGESSSKAVYLGFGTTRYGNSVRSADGTERSAGTWRVFTHLRFEQPAPWPGTIKWGAKLRRDKYSFSAQEPFLGIQGQEDSPITLMGHIGTTWRPSDGFSVTPSVGSQVFLSGGYLSVEPRLRFSYQPGGSDDMKLTGGGGLYRQVVTGVTDERDAGSTFQALIPTPFKDRPPESLQGLLGWNHRLTSALHVSLEGWYKEMKDLPVPRWTPVVRFNTNLTRANGRAFGTDVTLQYNDDPIRLDLSYGYSRVRYSAAKEALGAWVDEPILEYNPPHDLRHKVSLMAQWAPRWFTASARWQYGSGLPFTSIYGYDTALEMRGLTDHPLEDLGTPRTQYQRPYSSRLPAYHRLDVSVKRTFDVSPWVDLKVEGGAINAYDRNNVFYIDIFTLDRVNQLPLLPYLSLELNFN